MNVKIVSDGTPEGTYVYDEQGVQMTTVTGVRWSIDTDGNSKVTLTLIDGELDVIAETTQELAETFVKTMDELIVNVINDDVDKEADTG